MKRILIISAIAILAATAAAAQRPTTKMEKTMTARGTFDVNVIPQPADDASAGPFGRFLLDKKFHGDIEAVSKGQMLGAQTAVEGSGGYVALEQLTGTLGGKSGSFMLQHSGTMKNGAFVMNVSVVPGSGTGELAGIAGTMKIIIENGKHSYELEYSFEK